MAQIDFSQFADPSLAGGAAAGGMAAMFAAFLAAFLIGSLVMYVYFGLVLMFTAKKLKTEPAWLAWVPIGNLFLMAKMAKMPTWPAWVAFGLIIPFLNFLVAIFIGVFGIIWTWKICEARGKPGWWALIPLAAIIPVLGWVAGLWGLVMWGILAWGK